MTPATAAPGLAGLTRRRNDDPGNKVWEEEDGPSDENRAEKFANQHFDKKGEEIMMDHRTVNLIRSLSKSQRNHLRIILSRETGYSSLRAELGIQKVQHFHADIKERLCSLNVGYDGKCTVESLPVPATPGPWKIYDAGRDDNLFIESNGRGSVCKLPRKGLDQRDRDLELANARLIAAAPELLESLKYMVAVSNWATTIQSKEQYDEMIATAEAAIRKVEGR